MPEILIAFASREGQTRKICSHIARRLGARGHDVHLLDLVAGAPIPGLERLRGVVVASSVHRGRIDLAMSRFLMCHAPRLGQVPSVFLSVSLSAASRDRDARAAIDEITQTMLHDVGWQPDEIRHVAGAVEPAALGLLERCAVHAVMHHHGIPHENDGRTELTDWSAVDACVDALRAKLADGDTALDGPAPLATQ